MTRPISVTPGRRWLAGAVTTALAAASLTAFTAAAHAAPTAPAAPAKAKPLTADQASVQARRTGKAVSVDAATTATDELTANADGSFTLNQSLAPVRRYQGGAWKNLDATLVKRADGGVGPALSSSDLVLSGGGSGPLATMKSGGASFSLDLPKGLTDKLPTPVLDGATATYALAPGLDLKVTADTLGGFSEVFVVKDAKAAANPALKKLSFATTAKGVDLATDQAGNLTAEDKRGKVLFSAPAPDRGVWDSAADQAAATVVEPKSGARLDAKSGAPAASSHAEPGAHAHTGKLTSEYRDGAVTLTPDQDLLAGKDTVWPLYIDPSYSAGGWGQNWTYVSSAFPSQSYWRTSDSTGLRVGYNGWESPYYVGRAFAQMSVAPELAGAQISSSTFYATETWSPSCSGRNVELWWTGSIGSGTTWNNQPGLISRLDTKNEAHGYSSSCPAQSVGFTMTGAMQSAVASGKSDITLGLRAGDEGDSYGWKKFQPSSMSISTTYNHAPTAPGSLSTSPATVCGANPPSVIGNGDVVLYAGVNDQDGGSLGVAFTLKKSDGTVVASSSTGSLAATAGTTSAFVIPRATLAAAANGAQTTFNWNVYTSDGSATSPVSSTCQFTFDPTVPGAPTITQAANPSYTVGTAATFTFTANATGSAPASFLYQLNGASPVSVAAVSGSANAAIKPSRAVNTLSVTAVSAGGNIGDTAVLVVNATAPAAAAENDLTGTGRADLALVGNQAGLPSGLWLSSGATADSVNTAVNNIGIQGTGANTPGAAADWNGSQAIVGHFRSGGGFNDVLQYNPANGTGHILYGAGDGSALTPNSGSQVNVNAVAFTSGQGGAKATQVANAGALYEIVHEDPVGIPGLLMVFNGQLALTNGVGTPGAYPAADASVALTSTNPAGGADWTGWTITTALVNNLPALYARNTTTGELWYYSPTVLANLAAVPLQGTNPTPNTPVKLAASGWTSAAKPVLQAADINRDGTADLWSVDGTGKVTANVFNGTAFSTLPSQLLVAPTHSWALSEGGTEGSRATSAGDSAGALPLSGDTGATWSGKDLFNPDVHLNGTGAGVLSTTTPAATLSADFSASVWVKPNAVDGVVLSQDGTSSAGFIVYADANSKQWYFCMSKADSSAWTYDCVHAGVGGGMAQIGVWTHLTVTYHASTKVMALYINGIEVGYGSHDPVAGFTGGFRVGDYMYSGGHRTFFNGAVSNVQTWAGTTLTPNQVALLSGTPGYVLFPSDDTNYSTGSSWSTSRATMTFNSGLLTITKANGSTWSVGSSGYPNAALTLQRDGNFGIYQQQAHQAGTGVWAAMVVSAGDCMFLQPDGNLVIYSSDGVPIWASGTNN